MKRLLFLFFLIPLSAHAVTTSFFSGGGDGRVYNTGVTWAATHDALSGTADGDLWAVGEEYSAGNFQVHRGFAPVDTSALDDTAVISAATFSAMPFGLQDGPGPVAIVQTSQADPAALADADFDQIGTTEGSDARQSSFTANVYNTWTLNATGRGWISLTGWTLLGLRDERDIDNTDPAVARHYLKFYDSAQAGTDKDPYLEVTYTIPAPATAPSTDSLIIFGLLNIFYRKQIAYV